MIARVTGTLEVKELDHVEIATPGGVGYAVQTPLSAYEALPRLGETATLHTSLVVREDGWQLFGFVTPFERRVFDLVRSANGVGPALALGLLSSLGAERLVRALAEKDAATLQSAPRVGRKKAEQLILDLGTRVRALAPDGAPGADRAGGGGAGGVSRPGGAATEDSIRALVSLGYTAADAERAVRAALDAVAPGAALSAPELIRQALLRIGAGAGGRA